MKETRSILNSLIACGVALAMVSTLAAQSVDQSAAKVVRLKGGARYSTGNDVWQPLKLGDVLSYQPIAEQNIVRIWENTLLGVDKLTEMRTGMDVVTETQLDLRAGHIT